MARLVLGTLIVLLTYFVVPAPATSYCSRNGKEWSCSDDCCYDYNGCCYNFAATYWYAWFLMTLLFLVCLCACIGCGGYGYRRYYVVRRVQYPPPSATVITTTPAGGYQQYGTGVPYSSTYRPYEAPPPPYNPAKGY